MSQLPFMRIRPDAESAIWMHYRGPHKMTMLAISIHANTDGLAHPTNESVANYVGVTPRKITAHIRAIAAHPIGRQWLGIAKPGGGAGRANLYRITIPDDCRTSHLETPPQTAGIVHAETPPIPAGLTGITPPLAAPILGITPPIPAVIENNTPPLSAGIQKETPPIPAGKNQITPPIRVQNPAASGTLREKEEKKEREGERASAREALPPPAWPDGPAGGEPHDGGGGDLAAPGGGEPPEIPERLRPLVAAGVKLDRRPGVLAEWLDETLNLIAADVAEILATAPEVPRWPSDFGPLRKAYRERRRVEAEQAQAREEAKQRAQERFAAEAERLAMARETEPLEAAARQHSLALVKTILRRVQENPDLVAGADEFDRRSLDRLAKAFKSDRVSGIDLGRIVERFPALREAVEDPSRKWTEAGTALIERRPLRLVEGGAS